ncbi:MAG TPA: glycoside hydrolase family 16 protein [Thermoanaerobaculia bacterium]|nr:glycoside hydrolase family 16 protein [Thermoanaerobaculia bacterium]
MRMLLPCLLVGLSASPAVTAPGGVREVVLESWRLVWSDEFEGSALDLESWTVEVMAQPPNEELQHYTDRVDDAPGANVWIEDGVLVIEARAEAFGDRSYTSGRIHTAGKREFRYGRFEARMRLPGGVGSWPAFWLLGASFPTEGWPACGEIDVIEGKGRLPDWVSGALHRGPDPERHRVTVGEHRLANGSFQQEWHRFAVEWEPAVIRWLVDDDVFFEVERPDTPEIGEWPFDRPFFLILNLAVGGWFDAPHRPPAPFEFEPRQLEVDWVRVWQRD